MRILTQSQIGSPGPDITGFWLGFWIATIVILIVVALVGSVITLVNRIERQAATIVMHLARGREAGAPFEGLSEVNGHLLALARLLHGGTTAARNFGGNVR